MTSEISAILSVPFDGAVGRIVEELHREGFVVVAEVDVGKVLKEKLDVDCRRYTVLGVSPTRRCCWRATPGSWRPAT